MFTIACAIGGYQAQRNEEVRKMKILYALARAGCAVIIVAMALVYFHYLFSIGT